MTLTPEFFLIASVAAALLALAYGVGRALARRKLAAAFAAARPWQLPTLEGWVARGWLLPELADALPAQLSPLAVFQEWATVDPESAREWRLREPVEPRTPFEAVVRDAWSSLPEAAQAAARERLAEAVERAGTWWGGAERGWNGRPLALPQASVTPKTKGLPLLPLEDLTAAPLPGPLEAAKLARAGDGVDLVLALAALRRGAARFRHPLTPKADGKAGVAAGMASRIATDVGRRVGAGLGAALGPIGSMVGQYLGELAGSLGGKAIAQQALPDRVTRALAQTSRTLSDLGRLCETDDFARAARSPSESLLDICRRLDAARSARRGALVERLWPGPGRVLVDETLCACAAEAARYQAAGDHFIAAARSAPVEVAGGMILQNPWLVRALPGGAGHLNAARAALNQAVNAIRES